MNTIRQRMTIALGLVLVLGAAGFTVKSREALISEGTPLLLELAPVDPRSLMQGDFMRLRFAIAPSIWTGSRTSAKNDAQPPDGYAVVKRAANNLGAFVRHHQGGTLAPDEMLIRYRIRNHDVRIVTNAWFFQEGTAHEFSNARYGEFRVAPDGEALLVSLRDKDLKVLVTGARK